MEGGTHASAFAFLEERAGPENWKSETQQKGGAGSWCGQGLESTSLQSQSPRNAFELGVLIVFGLVWGPMSVYLCVVGVWIIGDHCLLNTYTHSKQSGDWGSQAGRCSIVRKEARRGTSGPQESLAGKGAEKAKEGRSTRKIYWADQMHRGG